MQGPIVVREDSGSTAIIAIVAFVVLVAAAIGLYFWQPWNATTTAPGTVIQQNVNPAQPAPAAAQNGAAPGGNSGTTTSGTTK